MKDDEALRTGPEPETTDGEETVGKDPAPGRQTGAEEPTAPMSMPPAASDPSATSTPNPPPAQRPAPPPDYVKRVYSPKLQEHITQRLVRAGIPEQDREDLLQNINKGLLFMGNPPDDNEGCAKAANDITSKTIAGRHRQKARRADTDAGLTDQADEHVTQDARELANGHHAQRLATVDEAQIGRRFQHRRTIKGALRGLCESGRPLLPAELMEHLLALATFTLLAGWRV